MFEEEGGRGRGMGGRGWREEEGGRRGEGGRRREKEREEEGGRREGTGGGWWGVGCRREVGGATRVLKANVKKN